MNSNAGIKVLDHHDRTMSVALGNNRVSAAEARAGGLLRAASMIGRVAVQVGCVGLLVAGIGSQVDARIVQTFTFSSFPALRGEIDQTTQSDGRQRISMRIINQDSRSFRCDGALRFRNVADGRIAPVADVYNSATIPRGTYELVAATLPVRSSVYHSPNDAEVSCSVIPTSNPTRTPTRTPTRSRTQTPTATREVCRGTTCGTACCSNPNFPVCDAVNNRCLAPSGQVATRTPTFPPQGCTGTSCGGGKCCNDPSYPICDLANNVCRRSSSSGPDTHSDDGGGGGGCQMDLGSSPDVSMLAFLPFLLLLIARSRRSSEEGARSHIPPTIQ